MFILTESAIDSAIDSISGYIVFTVQSATDKPLEEVSEAFMASRAYQLLSDKETGYYWDSISELMDMFTAELSFA